MRLQFQVKGSAQLPYKITAEGSGEALKIFCSCPAGRRGGLFCKHIAALLLGDVSKLVEPSDSVEALNAAAQGSGLTIKAMNHQPAQKERLEGFATLQDVLDRYGPAIEALGYVVTLRAMDDEGFRSEHLDVFKRTKAGVQRKHPSFSLTWTELTYDLMEMPDGTLFRANVRPRARPWNAGAGSYGSLGAALPVFLRQLGLA